MTHLSDSQHDILTQMRNQELIQEAYKLQGLFGQLNTRSGDAQITELIASMVKKYIGTSDISTYLESYTLVMSSEGTVGTVLGSNGFEDPPQCTGFEECSLPNDHFEPHNSDDPIEPIGKEATNPQPPKVRLELVDFGFLIEMAKVMQEGIRDGRKPGDWQKPDQADKRGSLLRHYARGEWAAVAVNAMILWWHERNKK